MTRPLQNSSFRWFFTGRLVSLLGSSMAPVAIAFAVLESSHSAGDLGIVLAARSIPLVLFLLVGGAVADRMSRGALLVMSNLGAALTQGIAALLLVSGAYHLSAIASVEFLNGTLTAFTSPALRGIVPQLVAGIDNQRANSLLATAKNAISVAGPTASGLVVAAWGGGWAIAADAATYLVAAFCMARLDLPEHAPGPRSALVQDLRAGWSAFRSLPWVCATVAAFAVTNCVYVGVWNVLGPTTAKASIGAVSWGVVLSTRAVGVLVSSAAMYRVRLRRLLSAGQMCFALGALPLVALGLRRSVFWLVPSALAAGLGQGVMGIAWDTSLQEHVPNALLSRIAAYDDLVSFIAVPIGQVAVAPLAAALGDAHVVVAGGILFGAAALAPLLFRSVRGLEQKPKPQPTPAT
ncbi:MFS transporter [Streptomyces sp. NPDC093598]|uniref:MFS transporter n=1 Tax=Streptomyces sp. NPDC093598 TaxID=3366046 RepID=UPI0038154E15